MRVESNNPTLVLKSWPNPNTFRTKCINKNIQLVSPNHFCIRRVTKMMAWSNICSNSSVSVIVIYWNSTWTPRPTACSYIYYCYYYYDYYYKFIGCPVLNVSMLRTPSFTAAGSKFSVLKPDIDVSIQEGDVVALRCRLAPAASCPRLTTPSPGSSSRWTPQRGWCWCGSAMTVCWTTLAWTQSWRRGWFYTGPPRAPSASSFRTWTPMMVVATPARWTSTSSTAMASGCRGPPTNQESPASVSFRRVSSSSFSDQPSSICLKKIQFNVRPLGGHFRKMKVAFGISAGWWFFWPGRRNQLIVRTTQ